MHVRSLSLFSLHTYKSNERKYDDEVILPPNTIKVDDKAVTTCKYNNKIKIP